MLNKWLRQGLRKRTERVRVFSMPTYAANSLRESQQVLPSADSPHRVLFPVPGEPGPKVTITRKLRAEHSVMLETKSMAGWRTLKGFFVSEHNHSKTERTPP